MKTRVLGWVVGAVLMAGAASAQEAADDAAVEPRPEPVRRIKVLQHPYDLASFYRSSQSSAPVYFGGPVETPASSRYPIASFYRQGGGQGRYSAFWSASGPGTRRSHVPARRRSRRVEAADLCLIAPTLLMPAAPHTDSDR